MVLILTAAGKDLLRQLFGSRLLAYVSGKLTKTPEVDQDTFISAVSDTPGTYEFAYDGSTWIYDGSVISLANYGITVTETALDGDKVIVKLYEEIASYVKFTSVSIGNGDQSALGETVTELGHEMNRPMMTACDRDNDFVTLTTYLNNNSVELAYRATEMGVWAENPDDTSEEILFAYGHEEPEVAMFIPAGGEYLMETTIILKVYVSDVEDVTASISQSMQFVTKPEFEGHTHDAGDIVSGVLSEEFGGTGVGSLDELAGELEPLLLTAEPFVGNIDDLGPGVVSVGGAATGHPTGMTTEQGYVVTFKSKDVNHVRGQFYLNTDYATQTDTAPSVSAPGKLYYRNRIRGGPWSEWKMVLTSDMDLTQFVGGTGGYSPAGHTHAATDIVSGTLPISRGGTGVATLANLAALLDGDASGSTAYLAKAVHTHSANDIASGILPVARGGTGASTLANLAAMLDGDASGSTAYLAKAAHTHSASDIVSGILSVARGGTGVDSMANLASALTTYLVEELRAYFAPVVGHYIGDSAIKRFIELGFTPSLLIVSDNGSGPGSDCHVVPEHASDGDNDWEHHTYGGIATPGYNAVGEWDNGSTEQCMTQWVNNRTAVMIGDENGKHGFFVSSTSRIRTNSSGSVYTYIAWR